MMVDTSNVRFDFSKNTFSYGPSEPYIFKIDVDPAEAIRFVGDPTSCEPSWIEALGPSGGVVAGQSVQGTSLTPSGGTHTFYYGVWKVTFPAGGACTSIALGGDVLDTGYRESAERIVYDDTCYFPPAPPSPPPPAPPPTPPPRTPVF